MTTTANELTGPRPAAPIAGAALRALRRFLRTPKGLMLLGLLLLTALATAGAGVRQVAPGLLVALGSAALLDTALLRLTRGAWQFPSGGILTALFVALILDTHEPWYVPLCTAVLAINSKYLFRSRWANIFNPAAIALVAAYFLFGSAQSWWGALPDLPLPFVAVLLAAAIFITTRVNKVPLALAFSGAYLGLFAALAFVRDPAGVAEIFRVPNTNALIFFAGFMLSDPPTSPVRPRDQITYGVIVALASAALYLTAGGVYFLPAGLLVGNAWEAARGHLAHRNRERARRERSAAGGRAVLPAPGSLTLAAALAAPAAGVARPAVSDAPLARTRQPWRFTVCELPALGAILALSSALNFVGLGNEGYANQYYAAAVRSMSENWHAFFFNSLDAAGFVTVDKPPLGFWIQVAAVKLLGYHGWSILLPEALAGVLAVALLWWLVRRPFGPVAGLVAALALAVTPISVVTNRNNTIDSLLVLALLGAAWAVTRAIEGARHPLRWLLLAATLAGLGFNIKMLEAYLALPALWLAYLVAARRGWLARVGHLALATVVLLAVSLSWAVAVDLTPPDQRPYVGSSQTNSVLELALGYNGLQRLLGRGGLNAVQNGDLAAAFAAGTGAQGFGPGGEGEIGQKGLLRLINTQLGGQIGWTLPLAVVGLALAGWQVRPRHLRFRGVSTPTGAAGLLRRRRAGVVLWGMWFLTMAAFFSIAGMFHRYYLTMLAPGVAALIGIGVVALWREWSRLSDRTPVDRRWLGWLLPVALVATAATQVHLLADYPEWSARLVKPILLLGGPAALALALARLLRERGRGRMRRLSGGAARVAVLAGLAALLIAPTAWSGISVRAADNGMVSNLPAAGPDGGGGFGAPGGNGAARNNGRPAANGPTGSLPAGIGQAGGPGRGQVNAQLVQWLIAHRGDAQYLVAVASAMEAAPIIIQTGLPVMATGGFSGGDPILNADKLAQLARSGAVRYFMVGGGFGGGFAVQGGQGAQPGAAPAVPPTGAARDGGRGGAAGQFPGAPAGGNNRAGNPGTTPGGYVAPGGNRVAAPGNAGNERATVQSWVAQHCAPVTDSGLGGQQLYDCGAAR